MKISRGMVHIMGKTPRENLTQLPMPTRSTEASTECFGRTVLSYLREDEQADASFFYLGDILHQTIEKSIDKDLSLEAALHMVAVRIDEAHKDIGGAQRVKIESTQRGFESMHQDADRMIRNWFDHVHPDSDKRHPIYDDYEWPPKTEVGFVRRDAGTRYPIWGSVDTIWTPKFSSDVSTRMIVDWKSGVKRPDSDFQLNFYRFGTNDTEATAHYHMLDRVQKRSIVVEADPYPGDAEVRKGISLTERRKEAIVKGYYPKFRPDWYCGYCPVQHICPADGDPRNRDKNRRDLERLLKKVEPMEEIPEEV